MQIILRISPNDIIIGVLGTCLVAYIIGFLSFYIKSKKSLSWTKSIIASTAIIAAIPSFIMWLEYLYSISAKLVIIPIAGISIASCCSVSWYARVKKSYPWDEAIQYGIYGFFVGILAGLFAYMMVVMSKM